MEVMDEKSITCRVQPSTARGQGRSGRYADMFMMMVGVQR